MLQTLDLCWKPLCYDALQYVKIFFYNSVGTMPRFPDSQGQQEHIGLVVNTPEWSRLL